MPCRELPSLSSSELDSFLSSFDVVMTDCDGVLWVGNEEIEGSASVINWLRFLFHEEMFCVQALNCFALQINGQARVLLHQQQHQDQGGVRQEVCQPRLWRG